MENIIFKQANTEIKKQILYTIGSFVVMVVLVMLLLKMDYNKFIFKYLGAFTILLFIFSCYGIKSVIVQKKSIKELASTVSITNISIASQEMYETSTISYEESKLYLTNHYLISLMGKHCIIPYEDIIWMYEVTTYKKGAFSGKNKEILADYINVCTNMGEIYSIASKTLINDVCAATTIYNRCNKVNPHIIFDYSESNKATYEAMQEKIKQMRQAGNDPRTVLRPTDIEHTPLY